MLLLTVLAFAAAADSAEPTAREAYQDCVRMAASDPVKAERLATQWVQHDGSAPARHCKAMAELELGRPADAATTLEAAAQISESAGARETADLYGQAGNAALIAGNAARAKTFLDRALVSLGRGRDPFRASLLVDRARAQTDLGQLDGARADLFSATRALPDSRDAWLLLAAAERRAGNSSGAETAIRQAIRLAPEDPEILAEAARIAASE